MNKYQKFVKENLTEQEILEQLAEEASELAQASLKLIRAKYSNNKTPVSAQKAKENLLEEIDDVALVIAVYEGFPIDEEDYPKIIRWAKRLGFKDE